MKKRDITDLVERMLRFEERLGVKLEGISAFITKEEDSVFNVRVRGEIHAVAGDEISEDIDLVLSIHDSDGRVIDTTSDCYYAEKFFGFETFDLYCDIDTHRIAKLRLFPKK